ncbi:hypothetical protein ABZS66_26660 [Dactylosporangium sp. NPDC005572]|uniref:hypothetical protein n=1 Tax=Dactylosporangium sp. NPDC005572 TaxID=3156889 RepID=UPI0033AC8DE8
MALELGNAVLGWLVAGGGGAALRSGRRLVAGDPQRAALASVVSAAIEEVTEQVDGLDAAQRQHLADVLGDGPAAETSVDIAVTSRTELRQAVADWIECLDEPQFGGDGYLTALGVRRAELAVGLADAIVRGIDQDARRNGPLRGLAHWLWRDSISGQLDRIELRLHDGAAPPPRDAYLERVRDIAPVDGLIGREAERRYMAEFCHGDADYLWWQADAWAGKTALLSTFVLDPPDGVDVVAFFITARLAGQTDSVAFTDVLLEQLCGLLNQPLPALSGQASRDAHRRRLLADAARTCRRNGRRLVLVVDGIDEDTGSAPDADLPSIASLLPARCPDDMKVILAGRHHPPIPLDVPDRHPIRRCRPHVLTPSPWAREIRHDAQLELSRRLAAGGVQRDIVGLITASGGGLTLDDLAHLTDRPRDEVEDLLRGVFGRTVRGRADPAAVDDRHVYLLAHETLRVEALRKIGPSQVDAYLGRVHDWARRYADAGWPESTPGYLFRGYSRMLDAHADLKRLVPLALDTRRHQRLLAATNTDAAALAEIRAAQRHLLAGTVPPLADLLQLAYRRDVLRDRSARTPAHLPGIWAGLGELDRAEALADSIANPDRHALSMMYILEAIASTTDGDRFADLATRAEEAARSVGYPVGRSAILSDLAALLAARGEADRARRLIDRIDDPAARFRTLRRLAHLHAEAGDSDAAERCAADVPEGPDRQALLAEIVVPLAAGGADERAVRIAGRLRPGGAQAAALIAAAKAMSAGGRGIRAAALIDRAESLVPTLGVVDQRIAMAASVVDAWLRVPDPARAAACVERAVADASATTGAELRLPISAGIAGMLAAIGDYDRAITVARAVERRHGQISVLSTVAEHAAGAGNSSWAVRIAGTIDEPMQRAAALVGIAQAAVASGDLTDAERIVEQITDERRQDAARLGIVHAAAAAGAVDVALRVAAAIHGFDLPSAVYAALAVAAGTDRRTRSDMIAHALRLPTWATVVHATASINRTAALAAMVTITPSLAPATMLSTLVAAVAEGGDPDGAERIAHAVPQPGRRLAALLALVPGVADTGDVDRRDRLLRHVDDPMTQRSHWPPLAAALAARGHTAYVQRVAETIEDPSLRAEGLTDAAAAALRVGDRAGARELAGAAESAARVVDDVNRRVAPLTQLAGLLLPTDTRRFQRLADLLEAVIMRIDDPSTRLQHLTRLARVTAGAREPLRVARLVDRMCHAGFGAAQSLFAGLREVAEARRAAGDITGAQAAATLMERRVDEISDPDARAAAVGDVIDLLVRCSVGDRAAILAAAQPSLSGRRAAASALASSLARAGHIPAADEVIAGIDTPGRQVSARIDAAAALVDAGHPNAARRFLEQALRQAEDGPAERESRFRVYVDIAEVLTRAGAYPVADHLVKSMIHDPAQQLEAALRLLRAATAAGENDATVRAGEAARQAALLIERSHGRARRLPEVLDAVLASGNRQLARRVAEDILARPAADVEPAAPARGYPTVTFDFVIDIDRLHDGAHASAPSTFGSRRVKVPMRGARQRLSDVSWVRASGAAVKARSTLAYLLAADGDYDEAARIVTKMPRGGPRSSAYVRLAIAAAARGDDERAIRLAECAEQEADAIDAIAERETALGKLTEALAYLGDLDRAERMARRVGNTARRAAAMTALVGSAARGGDLDRAEQFLAQISDSSWQAAALDAAVNAVLAAPDADNRRRLLATTLVVGSWTLPLDHIAALEPQALGKVADEAAADLATASTTR